MYRVGKRLFPLPLAQAREKHTEGKAEKLKSITVTSELGVRHELPLYREILWRSSNLSARMSPPIPIRKKAEHGTGHHARLFKSRLFRKTSNSGYWRLLDSGASSHTCSDTAVRPCAACTLEFSDQPYPIRRTNVSISGMNGPMTIFSAVCGHVKEKKVPKKKVGGTETVEELTTEWETPENDPRVLREL